MASPTNAAQPSPEAEFRLTFGVEIEFILATVDEGKENPNPNDPREVNGKILSDHDAINYDICRKLKEAGIPAIVQEVDHKSSTDTLDITATNWLLKTDVTVGLSDPEDKDGRYTEFGLEMSSPPYYYDEASRKAVETVLKVIRNNYLVRVDKTTGLHVHVGNSYYGLEWRVLRNLMAIAWTYERQLLLILPEERVANRYCQPLRESTLGLRHPELTRLEFLNRILSFVNNQHVISELTGTEVKTRLGFNIGNLKTPFSNHAPKRTIEFRHHPGSLEPKDILHWIHICVKMVEKACFIKDEKLFNRLRTDVEKPIGFEESSVSTVDYLMWLGCPAQAYYYGEEMVANKAQIEKRIKEEAKKDAMDLEMYREEGHVDVQGHLSVGMAEK
ncbi:eff503e8-4636-47ed-a1cd-9c32c3a13910 [Sclerotinia trifoliorum]|uniref:Eff503e8-4636-47ed-a1cd-9c32c3a13910 n=1 Tax=Sclerotinia trifoliorum TaxID=28548 RepID=A0A8H2W0Q6_9HELO|nr:eff503e8-4636-47ed-a1cd-9c32c3a13910 [Sclerotinia trifoliorum]